MSQIMSTKTEMIPSNSRGEIDLRNHHLHDHLEVEEEVILSRDSIIYMFYPCPGVTIYSGLQNDSPLFEKIA